MMWLVTVGKLALCSIFDFRSPHPWIFSFALFGINLLIHFLVLWLLLPLFFRLFSHSSLNIGFNVDLIEYSVFSCSRWAINYPSPLFFMWHSVASLNSHLTLHKTHLCSPSSRFPHSLSPNYNKPILGPGYLTFLEWLDGLVFLCYLCWTSPFTIQPS